MKKQSYLLGVLLCLAAVLSWGAMFPVMGSALRVMNPFLFTALRYTAAAVVLLGLLWQREGVQSLRADGRYLSLWVLGSLAFAGFGFFVFWGQQLAGQSGAVIAAVMMALMPFLGVIFNALLGLAKPSKVTVGFVLLSFAGVLLVVTRGDLAAIVTLADHLIADLLILLGASCWVLYTIGGGTIRFADWSPLRYSTLSTLYGLPTIWAVNLALHAAGSNPWPNAHDVLSIGWELAYMSLIAGVLAVLAWNAGNKVLGTTNGVLFINVVPITTLVIAAFQGYHFSSAELIGTGVTVSSLVLNNVYQRLAERSRSRRRREMGARALGELSPCDP